ncbi:MAG TPA: CBS domain-containing protein [Thermomicrobiales bacterium]|nr:CBS domain-containing protein [Thermomicrobiales bacterium]
MSDGEQPVSVRQIMRPCPTVSPDDSVATVARLMADHRLSGLPVVDRGELVGIITEADLITREATPDMPTLVPYFDAVFVADAGADFGEEVRRIVATTAGQLMTSPVLSLRDTATLTQVATFFLDRDVNQAPVVDARGELVGIVSRSDLIPVIAKLEALG